MTMARHVCCARVLGIPDCDACRRNPVNAHPCGDWHDEWQAPVLDAANPATPCRSAEPLPPADLAPLLSPGVPAPAAV